MVAMCMNGLQGKGTSIDHALVFARRISIVVKSQHLGAGVNFVIIEISVCLHFAP